MPKLSTNLKSLTKAEFSNCNFIRNEATNSGGALMLLFNYSNILTTIPNIFTDNTALFNPDISDDKPSYYRFSYYQMLSDEKIKSDDQLLEMIGDETLTVKLLF